MQNVATKFGITRDVQDRFAEQSHSKCLAAQESGLFKEEIVPLRVKVSLLKAESGALLLDVPRSPGIQCGKVLLAYFLFPRATSDFLQIRGSDGVERETVVDQDEGPRRGTTMAALATLKPAFQAGGTTTAGRASSFVHSLLGRQGM